MFICFRNQRLDQAIMTDDKNKECPLLRDTAFVDLMKRRIFNVLLIANPYDAFMLEDDGRVEEKIFDEYVKLGSP